MDNKKSRNSSIEVLRIIAMLLIIAQHYVYHGGYDRTIFDSASVNIIFLKILSIFGYSACTFFTLISGYFLIKADTGKEFYRRLIPLILETVFYSLISLLIVMIFHIVPLSLKDIIKQILSVFYGNWYIVFYLLLLLFVPFINPFLQGMKKEMYKKMLMLCIAMFVVIQTFLGDVYSLNNIDFMFMVYAFGAYIQLYPEDFSYKNSYNLVIGLLAAFVVIGSVIGLDMLGIFTKNVKFIQNDTFLIRWNTIPSFAFSLFIFIYASKLYFSNRWIDLLSSTTLGIYLIHDGLLKTLIWEKISPNIQYVDAPYVHALIKILAVFFICALIDLVRQIFLERPVMKLIKKTKLYR